MLFLVLTYLTTHAHTLGEEVHQLVVEIVNLVTELCDAFSGLCLAAYHEEREDIVEHVWCNLLFGVAPCAVGIAMALNDKAVETEVHCLLTQWCNEFTASADV